METHLGFVGAGFVGGAMIRGLSGYFPMTVYDKGKGIGSLKEVAEKADIIFVAVPTPMRKNGMCDTRIVEDVLHELNREIQIEKGYEAGVEVVVRSTLPPRFFENMQLACQSIELVFMPEFLTERTADLDFINSPRFLLGVEDPTVGIPLTQIMLEHRFPHTPVRKMTWEEASLVKHGTNVFFTVKLSFFNEIHQLAQEYACDPDTVIAEILQDGRIGRSHAQVPGHDGDFGWGGVCFPKDNRSFVSFASNCSVMAQAAWEVNENVRSKRDWEEKVGRAVSED